MPGGSGESYVELFLHTLSISAYGAEKGLPSLLTSPKEGFATSKALGSLTCLLHVNNTHSLRIYPLPQYLVIIELGYMYK